MRKHLATMLVAVGFLAVGFSTLVERANAGGGVDLATSIALSQIATASASYTPSFAITCATTPTPISHGDSMFEVACYNKTATSVFLGTSTVDPAAGLFCLSTDDANCAGKGMVWGVTNGVSHCAVASGTVQLICMRTR